MSNPYAKKTPVQFWRSALADVAPSDVAPIPAKRFTIQKNASIATAGSCFAQHVARSLRRMETVHHLELEAIPDGEPLFSARYGNIYTARHLRQLLDEAFDHRTFHDRAWRRKDGRCVDPFRPFAFSTGLATCEEVIDKRAEHLAAVRRVFCDCDVFIFTLGLTEAWVSVHDEAVFPVAPGVVSPWLRDSDYAFKNFRFAEIHEDLCACLTRLQTVNPQAQVILTVSPVPLTATYTDEHVLVATTYSKSVLRGICGEIATVLDHVHYFPSYEVITGQFSRGAYFDSNLRTVNAAGVAHVMRLFGESYLSQRDSQTLRESRATPLAREDVICDEEEIVKSIRFGSGSTKALVISNCATHAYASSLKTVFPDWSISGAMITKVEEYRHHPTRRASVEFFEFARQADVYVGFEPDEFWPDLPLNPNASKVVIPPFVFHGLHPDALQLDDILSPLDAGNLFSRIATAGFALDYSIPKTVELFQDDTYDRLGYPAVYDSECDRLLEHFRRYDIHLDHALSQWQEKGVFLYTVNHPKVFVLFDVLRHALRGNLIDLDKFEACRLGYEDVEDKLDGSIHWPAYGMTAMASDPLVWSKGHRKRHKKLPLAAFVKQTYKRLKSAKSFQPESVPDLERAISVIADLKLAHVP